MKRIIILCIFGGLMGQFSAAQGLTIESCRQKAMEHYPGYRQYELISQSGEIDQQNLGKAWLPEMNIIGQASYQSDVTKIPIELPQFTIEPVARDQYRLYLDFTQMIYDGGSVRQNKALESYDRQIDRQNLGIELFQLRHMVDQVFFSLILIRENQQLLMVSENEIRARLKDVESAIRNGVVLEVQADILRAELMKLEQRQAELRVSLRSGYAVLSQLTGLQLTTEDSLQMPEPEVEMPADAGDRLEFGLFSLQQQKLESMKRLQNTRLSPRLMAYGQAGVGRPAFDMLKNDLTGYYIFGARLNWTPWNWNKTRNEKKIMALNQEIVESRKETFSQNISIELENRKAEIGKFEALIAKDAEILALRKNIVFIYSSQLGNGVITATEYLSELNAETQARMNLEIHKVQLIQSKYQYLSAAGK